MKKVFIFLVSAITFLYAQSDRPALVTVTKVKKEVVNSVDAFTGTVQFAQSAKLASQTSGKVEKLFFEVGDEVQKGQNLVAVDSAILDAQLENALADFEKAKLDFARYSALQKKDAVAQKVYDDSRFSYLKTKAVLKQLQVQKEQKMIKAPFAGMITQKNIEIGEWVNPGSAVANIKATQEVQLLFNVPKLYASSLQIGTKYEINIAKRSYFVPLHSMIASGDKITRTFPVKFKLQVKDFVYEGMEAVAKLPKQAKQQHLIVPRDAVINRFGGNVIFVVEDAKAQLKRVQITGYAGENVGVEAQGLKEGMQVVTKGNERIFPDQKVKIIKQQDKE